MAEALLTAQLLTLPATWTLGVKLWTPFLRTLSRATGQKKTRKPPGLLSAGGSTNLPMKSVLPTTPGKRKPQKSPQWPHPEWGKHSEATGWVEILAESLSTTLLRYTNTQGDTQRARSVGQDKATTCKVLKVQIAPAKYWQRASKWPRPKQLLQDNGMPAFKAKNFKSEPKSYYIDLYAVSHRNTKQMRMRKK